MKKFIALSFLLFGICEIVAQTPNPSNGAYWGLTGNSGTNPSTNFIGTTDNTPLIFKIHNTNSGFVNKSCTSFGFSSINPTTSLYGLSAFGSFALQNNLNGEGNSAFGFSALRSNINGNYNCSFGLASLQNNNGGSSNSAFGYLALFSNTYSNFNSAFGDRALYLNVGGSENSSFGFSSLYYNVDGDANSSFGNASLRNNKLGNSNVALGHSSLFSNFDGNNNTAVGTGAGSNSISGHNNLFLGFYSNIPSNNSGISNQLVVETSEVEYTNPLIHGSFSENTLRFNGGVEINNISNTDDPNTSTLAHSTAGLRLLGIPNTFNNKFLTTNEIGDVILQDLPSATNSNATWQLSGNQVTNPNNFFIGTKDDLTNNDHYPLKFKVNDEFSGNLSMFFTSFGYRALTNNTNKWNNAFGAFALENNIDGGSNIAFGDFALRNNISGFGNIAIGHSALSASTNSYNLALGCESGVFLTSGSNNTFIGNRSGYNTLGSRNVFLGNNSGYNELGSDKLYISNSNTPSPLIWGDFATRNLKFNVNNSATSKLTIESFGTVADGRSGLNFKNLTSSFEPTISAKKFLTVNNLGDVVLQNLPVTTNTLTNSANTLKSTVNGIIATAPAVNTVVNTITGNSLVTKVNGIPSAAVTLPSSSFTEIDGSITNELQTVTATATGFTLSNNGGSINFPVLSEVDGSVTNELQTITSTPTGFELSNNGGTINFPVTNITSANTNTATVTQTGTNFSINTRNIYSNDGALSSNRFVNLANYNLQFSTGVNGRIYIGNSPYYPTTTGDYRLYVEGGVLSERVRVALRKSQFWADNVFANNYKLMPLKEVENFINQNKHLPGIESAEELVKNGLDLGDMQAKQMGKIEELTLHLIEQNKMLEKQSKEIEELKSLVKSLVEKE